MPLTVLPVLSMMGKSSGVEFFAHVATWLGLVRGQKHWMLKASETEKPGEPSCGDHEKDLARTDVIHCVQQPGEIIYFPQGWWHATCNMEDFTLAVGGQEYQYGWSMSDVGAVLGAIYEDDWDGLVKAVSCPNT